MINSGNLWLKIVTIVWKLAKGYIYGYVKVGLNVEMEIASENYRQVLIHRILGNNNKSPYT